MLDFGAQRIAFFQDQVALNASFANDFSECLPRPDGLEAHRILTTLPRIRLAANTIHGDGQGGMGLGGNGTQRHGASGKTLDDLLGRFDFVDGDRRSGRLDLEQAAQGHVPRALVVDELGILLIGFILAGTRRVLQLGDCVRRPHVVFAADAEGILAARIKHAVQHRIFGESPEMGAHCLFSDFCQADALDLACSAGEVF